MSLHDLTLEELSAALARRDVTSRAATEHALARVKALDGKLRAFLLVDDAGALRAADESDARTAAGQRRGPLDGVPLALKDIFCTRGLATTCASRILQGYVPPYDATPVQRLRAAGAVLLGKLNMDEFAMGSSGENSAFGPTRNPWDLERTPGGSSSGSAAAVAARLCWGALGTDTGGSIREPAAFSGVVGFKPTYGRVSRYGVIAFASSLDQVGPFGRTVRDAALQLGAIAGHDPLDQTSAELDVRDEGAGIPPELREHVFERYVRLAGARAEEMGRGLGLTFCRLAVEAHGGRIWAEANEPKGSRFRIRLPRRRGASA